MLTACRSSVALCNLQHSFSFPKAIYYLLNFEVYPVLHLEHCSPLHPQDCSGPHKPFRISFLSPNHQFCLLRLSCLPALFHHHHLKFEHPYQLSYRPKWHLYHIYFCLLLPYFFNPYSVLSSLFIWLYMINLLGSLFAYLPASIPLFHQKLVCSPPPWLSHFGWRLVPQVCHNLSFTFGPVVLNIHSSFSSDLKILFP